ncbi:hypothetical protein CR513_18263, partial [Mucuna pruriens]
MQSNFLKRLSNIFAKNEKAETSNLLAKLITMKYKGKGNIREYIMEMSNLTAKLKSLKLEIAEDLLVHLVLISLPAHFGQFKVSYNTQKDKWSLNELISHCVQVEERLQRDKTESAYFVLTSQNNKRKKIKGAAEGSSQRKKLKKKEEFTCYFCKKSGHMKKQCPNRPPSDDERFIFVGDDNKVAVEAIGTFRLQLKTGFCLDLFETFVVPSFRQNLVSISSLDRFSFSCSFGNNKVSLYQNSNVVGSGSLIDNLYMLDVVSSYNEILQTGSRGTKRKLIENSAMLWHKRLGHISKQRIQRLVSDEILEPLDLSNLEVCVECIKGKRTNIRKLGVERVKDVLELIHTDICGPFPTAS